MFIFWLLGSGKFTYSIDRVNWELSISVANKCVSISWNGESSYEHPLRDCFHLGENVYWYGGYEVYKQNWPINEEIIKMIPFLSNNTFEFPQGFGPVLHPVWFSSKGVVLYVDHDVPLHVSLNDVSITGENGLLCLQAVPYALSCTPDASQLTSLRYTICHEDDPVSAVKYFLQSSGSIGKPGMVSEVVFEKPIWSTWAQFKRNVNDSIITEYLDHIFNNSLSISQLEIDDGYTSNYGDLVIDSNKFPSNFSNIVEFLKNKLNASLTVWIHPFVNYDTNQFKEVMKNASVNYFIPGGSMDTTGLVKWWNGHGALINFESKFASEWFKNKIELFQKMNQISAFKFDAGESEYLPDCLYFPDSTHPATFTKKYINFASSIEGSKRAEVRVGYFSQNQSIFIRMLDRSSDWGINNGLHSVLTTALTMSLIGYNYIIPDMIGGNACSGTDCTTSTEGNQPLKDLYIRWMQLSAFLPVMQFSIPPWNFGQEVVDQAKLLIAFHEWLAKHCIIPLVKASTHKLEPIIRPLWWLDHQNEKALTANDTFLVGNCILVAPILHNSTVKRTVYLPPGSWKKCDLDEKEENKHICNEKLHSSEEIDLTIPLGGPMSFFKNTVEC